MQIAPRADPLIVEAKVAPQDIDQVEVGAPVRIRVEAGNRRTMRDLEGSVTVLSPDVMHEQPPTPAGLQTKPYYVARASVSAQLRTLAALHSVQCRPVDVYLRLQDGTPLDYRLKPLHEQIARTFRER